MKKLLAMLLAALTLVSCSGLALADKVESQGCLVLGEDLKAEEKAKVLEFLQVKDPDQYTVSYTTNRQEHEAFDDYLGADVVGKRALSSILLVPRKKGEGITISSYNITYCTVEMYQNALISAGVKDVALYIAAPVPVSGTCALVSAMNAYSLLTGEKIDPAAADAAADELATTAYIGEDLGDKDTAAKLIALLKQKMIQDNMGEEELGAAIDQVSGQLGVSLTPERKSQLITLLLKIKNADIDVDALAEQAAGLYNQVSGLMKKLDIKPQEAAGFLERLMAWVSKLLSSFGIG